jgi:heat shock protein HspQ
MITRLTPSTWAPSGATPGAPTPDLSDPADEQPEAPVFRQAKFGIGQVVKHRVFSFRGVIFDVDPVFANTEEWWQAIPAEVRPHKDQPFYHLLAENDEGGYVAYVSEQNLLPDMTGEPVGNPNTSLIFDGFRKGQYHLRPRITH